MRRASSGVVVAAFLISAVFAGGSSKPPAGDAKPVVVEASANLPQGHGYVSSEGQTVLVSRTVKSYGPVNQVLYVHKNLLPPDGTHDPTGAIALVKSVGATNSLYGPYFGQIRVLDDRLDYFFDISDSSCVQENASQDRCRFRLVVADGTAVYAQSGKKRVLDRIAFSGGRTLLDYRPCDPAVDPVNCYFRVYGCYNDVDCPGVNPDEDFVYASFDVRFPR